MGVNNRERRRAKKHKRQRDEAARGVPRREERRRSGDTGHGSHSARLDERLVREAVVTTAEAFRFESEEAFECALETLVVAVEAFVGRPAIEAAVQWWVEGALDRAWSSGWQPADVVRIVGASSVPPKWPRLLTPSPPTAPGAPRRPATSGGRPRPPPSPPTPVRPRLAAHGPSTSPSSCRPSPSFSTCRPCPAWRRRSPGAAGAARGLCWSGSAPCSPRRSPPRSPRKPRPSRPRRRSSWLATPSTKPCSTPPTAEAPLPSSGVGSGWRTPMRRRSRCSSTASPPPTAAAQCGARTWASPRRSARRATSRWSRCSSPHYSSRAPTPWSGPVGRSVDRSGRSRTRSFRQSFLLAYAIRIGERLAETTDGAVAEAVERHGGALLPVLAGRAEAVDDAVAQAYPDMVKHGLAITNPAGWVAGRAAAELARLTVRDELATG